MDGGTEPELTVRQPRRFWEDWRLWACLLLLFLLGGGGLAYRWLGARAVTGGPVFEDIEARMSRPAVMDRLIDVLSGRAGDRAGKWFAKAFHKDPRLAAAWDRYRQTGDAEGFRQALAGEPAFGDLLAQYKSVPPYDAIAAEFGKLRNVAAVQDRFGVTGGAGEFSVDEPAASGVGSGSAGLAAPEAASAGPGGHSVRKKLSAIPEIKSFRSAFRQKGSDGYSWQNITGLAEAREERGPSESNRGASPRATPTPGVPSVGGVEVGRGGGGGGGGGSGGGGTRPAENGPDVPPEGTDTDTGTDPYPYPPTSTYTGTGTGTGTGATTGGTSTNTSSGSGTGSGTGTRTRFGPRPCAPSCGPEYQTPDTGTGAGYP